MESDNKKHCRNCSSPISEDSKFCTECGQKNTDGKVSLLEFVKDFFTNLFDIDSKLFLTFFALFIPGKLTVEYFKGKHKSYASPVRMFLFAGITLFAVVITKTQNIDFGGGQITYTKNAERTRVKEIIKDNIARYQLEFLDTTAYYQTDSLSTWISKEIGSYSTDSIRVNNLLGSDKLVKISTEDLANMPTDSILVKYKIGTGFTSMLFSQQIKSMRDGKGLFHFFIGKLPIMIFLMMPFLALFLKLLYVRHKHFFVEHLVFSFHYHTFAFFITLILVLFGKHFHGLLIAAFVFSIFIYQFMATRRFYGQGFFLTLVKFSILNFLYIFLAIFFFVAGVSIIFLLF